jgi:hypothetical protein
LFDRSEGSEVVNYALEERRVGGCHGYAA